MSKKCKKVCRVFNYIEPNFASSVGILTGITSSTTGLKICLITARIKKYKAINRKNKKKHDKIIL